MPKTASSPTDGRRQLGWFIGGLLALVGVLVCLPSFYFTEDDNYAQVLPNLLLGIERLLNGVVPVWNPHNHLGHPLLELGYTLLSYPPVYVAYGIARLMGNTLQLLEVLAMMHLLGAYAGSYWASRELGLRREMAVAAALSLVLSGFMLITGRSWIMFLCGMAWLPVIVGLLARLARQGGGLRWACAFGLTVGLSYHGGFVQLWIMSGLFLGLMILVWCGIGQMPWRRLLRVTGGGLIGLAMAAPLLWKQWQFTRVITRERFGQGIGLDALPAMIFPQPLVDASLPGAFLGTGVWEGAWYFSGGVFVLATLLAVRACLRGRLPQMGKAQPMVLLAVVALWLSFGDSDWLWRGLTAIPGFSHFNYSYRSLAFFYLFTSSGGAMLLQAYLQRRSRIHRCGRISVAICVLLVTHTYTCRTAFTDYPDPPYPALDPLLAATIGDGRVAPFGRIRSVPITSVGIGSQLASHHGLLRLDGYEPLSFDHALYQRYVAIELNSDPFGQMNKYHDLMLDFGVRWLLIEQHRLHEASHFFPHVSRARQMGNNYLLELEDAAPLAFVADQAYPVSFDCSGADVDLGDSFPGGGVVLNVLGWPAFRCSIDGVELPHTLDHRGRIVVEVPPGTEALRAQYAPRWGGGFWLAATALILALPALAAARHFR